MLMFHVVVDVNVVRTGAGSARVFCFVQVERDEAEISAEKGGEVQDQFSQYTADMLKDRLKEMGLKATGKKADLLARIRGEVRQRG